MPLRISVPMKLQKIEVKFQNLFNLIWESSWKISAWIRGELRGNLVLFKFARIVLSLLFGSRKRVVSMGLGRTILSAEQGVRFLVVIFDGCFYFSMENKVLYVGNTVVTSFSFQIFRVIIGMFLLLQLPKLCIVNLTSFN